jgi:hypothetical protein
MKKLLLLFSALLICLFVVGCNEQTGQKVGYVNCCVKKSDGTKTCTNMQQGQCQNTPGATIISDCKDCK